MKLLKKFQEWREISYGVVEEDEVFLGFLKIGFMEERERERERECGGGNLWVGKWGLNS